MPPSPKPAASELLRELEASPSDAFAAAVGNPPYQVVTARKATEHEKKVANIFHLFQQVADAVATASSFVYPGARWLHQGAGLADFGREQVNSEHLRELWYFPTSQALFGPEVGVVGGLSVTLKDAAYSNGGEFTYRYCSGTAVATTRVAAPGEKLLALDPLMASVVERVRARAAVEGERPLREVVYARAKPFGIRSSFAETHAEKLFTAPPAGVTSVGGDSGWVRVLTNHKAGKAGRATWFWLRAEDVPTGRELVASWKVVISSMNLSGVNGRSPQVQVLAPGEVFGRVKLCLRVFDSEEEARNFSAWYSTDLVRFLVATTEDRLAAYGRAVPLLESYRTGAVVGVDFTEAEAPLGEQLLERYGLTAEDGKYLRGVVSRLAPLTRTVGG